MKNSLLSLIFLPLFFAISFSMPPFVSADSGTADARLETSHLVNGLSYIEFVNLDPAFNYSNCSLYNSAQVVLPNSSVLNASGDHGCGASHYTIFFNGDMTQTGNYTVTFTVDGNTYVSNFSINNSEVKIITDPENGNQTVGSPFNVSVQVTDNNADSFNAVRSTVTVSSNLEIVGIHTPSSNACNLHYTTTPTTSNPSFAGAIYGGSSEGCTVYTMTLKPTESGTGTVTFTNASVKGYSDNSEIITGVTNASFTLANGTEPTPTPLLEFQVTSPLQTYKTNYNIAGTKLSSITHIFVNGSDEDTTYPSATTWSVPLTLSLGNNNYTLYGADDESNQTATQTVTIDRHILGDINGDGEIDLIDASLFAVDWDKTEDLTYVLSDMNDDGVVDLTDLSILAKLQD